jgi:hypothetical protein
MLYPKRGATDRPEDRQRLLAYGAAFLFVISALFAFAGSVQGAFGAFAAAMALKAVASAPLPVPRVEPGPSPEPA